MGWTVAHLHVQVHHWNLRHLLSDIAQPGLVCPAATSPFRTAYSQVMAPAARAMRLCPGHPGEGEWVAAV